MKNHIYTPINFNPLEICPAFPNDLKEGFPEWAKQLVSIILNKSKDEAQFTFLKTEFLRQQIHRRWFTAVKTILIENGVIKCDQKRCPGEKCFGYKLAEAYHGQRIVTTVGKETPEPEFEHRVHKQLWHWLNKTTVDYDGALTYLDKTKTKNKSLKYLSLEKLKAQDFFFHCDPRGRVYHNIACMWSQFRQFLRINEQPLINIDITNSQPLIFAILLKQESYTTSYYYINTAQISSQSDLQRYIQLVEEGKLYDTLMTEFDIPAKKRKHFKKRFFAEVFYGKLDYESKLTKRFAELFPSVFESICHYKEDDHRKLPLSMQRIEADLMIGDVCLRLTEDHPEVPFLTIHDSILTTAEHVNKVKLLIEKAFGRVGLKLRFN